MTSLPLLLVKIFVIRGNDVFAIVLTFLVLIFIVPTATLIVAVVVVITITTTILIVTAFPFQILQAAATDVVELVELFKIQGDEVIQSVLSCGDCSLVNATIAFE